MFKAQLQQKLGTLRFKPRLQRERERQKNKQNNSFVRASHFFVHFFAVFARLRRENA